MNLIKQLLQKVAFKMKHYDVAEAFIILKQNKITTNEESVRRWLRQGVIKGITPTSRKEGWLIREDDLYAFVHNRLPDEKFDISVYTTNDVREAIRANLW